MKIIIKRFEYSIRDNFRKTKAKVNSQIINTL